MFDFAFSLLVRTGAPFLRGAARGIWPFSETPAEWLVDPTVQYVMAALVTLAGLCAVGLLTSLVVGRRLILLLDRLVNRLPLVQTIDGATRRFLQSLQNCAVSGQRVVLIRFPSPEMRAVGFIIRVLRDADTGRQLAAVYVPTSPDPTSGYIEIRPMENVVLTDWSIEEAMSFVITGGTNAPERVDFGHRRAGADTPTLACAAHGPMRPVLPEPFTIFREVRHHAS